MVLMGLVNMRSYQWTLTHPIFPEDTQRAVEFFLGGAPP